MPKAPLERKLTHICMDWVAHARRTGADGQPPPRVLARVRELCRPGPFPRVWGMAVTSATMLRYGWSSRQDMLARLALAHLWAGLVAGGDVDGDQLANKIAEIDEQPAWQVTAEVVPLANQHRAQLLKQLAAWSTSQPAFGCRLARRAGDGRPISSGRLKP